jgi:hypothetical protein
LTNLFFNRIEGEVCQFKKISFAICQKLIKQEEIEKINADEKLIKTKMMEEKIKMELDEKRNKEKENGDNENNDNN